MFKLNLCYLQIRIFCNSRTLNRVACPQKGSNLISPLCYAKREIYPVGFFAETYAHQFVTITYSQSIRAEIPARAFSTACQGNLLR